MSRPDLTTSETSLVQYVVHVLPEQHELKITVQLSGPIAVGTVDLEIPSWVPGYYSFQPYARDLFELTACDTASNSALKVSRNGWQGFRIEGCSGQVTVNYNAYAYANDFSEDSGIVEETYAILMGTRYLYAPAYTGPCSVQYELPANWKMHHPSVAQQSGDVWQYPSYEILLDTPVVVGQFDLITRTVQNVPIYGLFVERGVGFELEVDAFVDRLAAIAEEFYRMFGFFPFTDYTFVMTLNPAADWGLEHLSSSSCALGPDVFTVPDQYAIGVRVCAHEMFHAWNVRRLRPSPLKLLSSHLDSGSFTEGLWVAEGFTRYYEFLSCTRIGVYNTAQFISNLIGYNQALTARPAYKRVDVLDSSLSTYLNHSTYSGRVNNSIDYYDKGMLIAFEIDAALRLDTTGNSLDQAFSKFYQTFVNGAADYPGYTTDDVISFFDKILPGLGTRIAQVTGDPGGLQTGDVLRRLGFEVVPKETLYLGLLFHDKVDTVVNDVLDNSQAGSSGIAPDDVLTQVNGYIFSPQALQWAATHSAPVTLSVLRGHRPLEFNITPARRIVIRNLIWRGSTQQADLIRQWLNDSNFNPTSGDIFGVDFYENFHGVDTLV